MDKPAIFSKDVNLFLTSFLKASLKCLNLMDYKYKLNPISRIMYLCLKNKL